MRLPSIPVITAFVASMVCPIVLAANEVTLTISGTIVPTPCNPTRIHKTGVDDMHPAHEKDLSTLTCPSVDTPRIPLMAASATAASSTPVVHASASLTPQTLEIFY